LLSSCSRAWPFTTGYAFNSLPPAQSVSYECSQPNVTARIESTLALTIPVLLRNFVAGFIVGPNGELDQQGSSATLLMLEQTTFAANVVNVQVFRNLLPVVTRYRTHIGFKRMHKRLCRQPSQTNILMLPTTNGVKPARCKPLSKRGT